MVCAASIAVVVTLSVSDVLFDIVTSSASEKVAAAPLVAVNLSTLPVKPFAVSYTHLTLPTILLV